MYISPMMTPAALWLLFVCFMSVVSVAGIYFYRVGNVLSYRRRSDHERAEVADNVLEPVSVIVYSQGEGDVLEGMLRCILEQDYPAAFEVIVVNEGASTEVRDTVSMLRGRYGNIYLTGTPQGVVNLSKKKLGITLGVKAARYGTVLLTTTAAEICSPLWIRRMMTPFSQDKGTEVVLGYCCVLPGEDCAWGFRRRAFDHVADSIRWLGVAIAGKPFRGVEYNIAYRKELFMRNKGFARTLNLHYGDDDIFVSEICHGGNTVVCLADESIVRLRQGNDPRLFDERVLRRYFTEGRIGRRPRILFELGGWLQVVALVSGIWAGVVEYPNMSGWCVAAVMLAGMAVLDVFFWGRAMIAMKSRRLRFTLPWFAMTYPLRRLVRHARSKVSKAKKYTWD